MLVMENFGKFGKLSFDLPMFYPQIFVLCQEVVSMNHGIDQKTCTGDLAFATIC